MKSFSVHPFAEFFPEISETEFQELKADIQRRGLREPILRIRGTQILMDGRHRLRACDELGIAPTFAEYDGRDGDIVDEIVSRNFLRRHLSASQRAEIAAKLVNTSHGGDRKSDQVAKLQLEKTSIKQAAKLLKVSPRSVSSARRRLAKGNKPKKPSVTKVLTFEREVSRRFQRMMDRFPITQHRNAKLELVRLILGQYDRNTADLIAPVSVCYPNGSTGEIEKIICGEG
jgi:hypothetical protein